MTANALNRPVFAATLIALLIALGVILYQIKPVTSELALLGLAILYVSCLPLIVELGLKTDSATPFFPAVGLFYAIFYGLPIFTIELAWPNAESITMYSRTHLNEIRPEAIRLVLYGVAGMVAAFYLARYTIFRRIGPLRLPHVVYVISPIPALVFLLAVHLLERYFPNWSGIVSAGQFFEPAGYVAFAGLFYLFLSTRPKQYALLVVLLIALPLELYARSHQLLLTDLFLFLLFGIFVFWRTNQLKFVAICVAVFLAGLTLYGTTAATRYAHPPGIERMIFSVQKYAQHFLGGKTTLPLEGGEKIEFWGRFGAIVMRTSHIWIFHIVDDMSPETVPYWNGESYRNLLTATIPRALYPGKPEERYGETFGKRYGFLEPTQTLTSINLSWLTELLVNFGRVGVLVGMLAIGLALALVDRMLNSRELRIIDAAIGSAFLVPLSYPESNLSVTIGSMGLVFIGLVAVFWLSALASIRLSKTRLH